ncbi:murein biosynthesis integral membrane protein MurJ [Rubritalea squalenifaciens]|nr:murein biosynthesis integral membrane protein MurJ [Rubritalea squalenifaciens]
MTVSGFTAISRVLGFLRDILIARYIGSGLVGDAFLSAFRFPNLFRRIFGEGAFNAAFIPMFGRRLDGEGQQKALGFASNAFSVLCVTLVIFSIIAIPSMKWIMSAVVPGFKPAVVMTAPHGEQLETVPFTVQVGGERNIYFSDAANKEFEGGRSIVLKNLRLVGEGDKVWTNPFGDGARTEELPLESFVSGYNEKEDARVEAALAQGEEASPVYSLTNLTQQGDQWVVAPGDFGRIRMGRGHDYGWLEGELVTGAGATEADVVEVYKNHPDTFSLTVTLSQITFCYLLFMALTAQLSGVLNTFKVFGVPAAAPILLNLVFLIGLVVFIWILGSDLPGHVLAWCVAVAGVLQFVMLWWSCHRHGYEVRLQKPEFNGEIKRLFVLMIPGIASAGIQQVNLLVGSVIASFQQGAISWLYYSDRVYQLPLGMIGIALGIVLLPEVTRLLRSGKKDEASESIVRGAEIGLLITLPAAIAMIVIPGAIISLLFERGEFTAVDASATSQALAGFALGLPGYVLIKVLQPGYFAREDTKTPMKMAIVTVLVNIVVSLALFPFIGHIGIAIATSVAAWVNVAMLWFGLKGLVKVDSLFWKRIGKLLLASVLMGLTVWVAQWMVSDWLVEGLIKKVCAVSLLIGLGMVVYAMLVLGLKAMTLQELKAGFRR